jgi:hypothetical protein
MTMRLALFLAASVCFAADTHFDTSYPFHLPTFSAGPGCIARIQWIFRTWRPVGDDGYFKPMWDKRTGEMRPEVAQYWKDNYDLRYYPALLHGKELEPMISSGPLKP